MILSHAYSYFDKLNAILKIYSSKVVWAIKMSPNEGNQDIGEHMPSKEVSRDHWFKLQVSAAHDWVANQNEGLKPKDSPHSVARLTSEVEGQLEAAGGLGLRTQRTTEYQVL